MILTSHALVGAAAGKFIPNIFLQLLILIPLHYIMDIFRHGEYLNKKSTIKNTWWKITLDLLIGTSIIFAISILQNKSLSEMRPMLTGAFISMFPDLLTVLYWKLGFKFLEKIFRFHQFVHSRFADYSPERAWTLRNAVNDIVFSAIAIVLLIL